MKQAGAEISRAVIVMKYEFDRGIDFKFRGDSYVFVVENKDTKLSESRAH